MLYFDHDTDASSDEKLTFMRLTYGGAAVDAYWMVLERIYREEKPLPFWADLTLPATLAHKLAVTSDELRAWVEQMVEIGLLDRDGDGLTSERANRVIECYHSFIASQKEKASKGGKAKAARWKATGKQRASNGQADAMPEPCPNPALREEKRREPEVSSKKETSGFRNARCPKCGNLLLKKQDGTGRLYCQVHGIVEVV